MPIKARIATATTSRTSPKTVRDLSEWKTNSSEKKPKYGAAAVQKLWCRETRVRLVAGILGVVSLIFLKSALSYNDDGPPHDLVVVGKRSYYQHVPTEFRKRFYIDDDNKFRRTVIRAFRNRGWKKTNSPQEAQFIWDKYPEEDIYSQLLPWQRYSHFPDFEYWEEKDYFVEHFQRYYTQNPEEPRLLPETYLLDTKARRRAFRKRLEQQGGYEEPWVLKIPNENNGSGITMMGPNSKELYKVFDVVDDHLHNQQHVEEPSRMIVQSYICNELTWSHHHKFDLRFYWAVFSIDPLIVVYHDGYVRVGNSNYDESDWSSTRQHLTTHTFLADEEKGTMQQLSSRIGQHYHDHKSKLQHIRVDPVTHVRNQMKAAIAQTAAAFKDITFGNDKKQLLTAENAYQYNGADFVIDNNLDVYYVEAQAGPGMEEEWDFRVEQHKELWTTLIDAVEEIQLKQEADPNANLLPLEKVGAWEIVYAGDWQYKYPGYKRPTEKPKCDLGPT